jgi:hypothetical protein
MRIWARLCGAFALSLIVSLLLAAPARADARIVAVGDLHGDHAAFVAILRAARLTDERGRWSGGDAILVQTGDVPDRGPDTLRIVHDLMRLQREASRAGGRVVALVGNHEAMMVTGDLRYVHPGEYAAFATRDSAERRRRFFEANRTAIEAHYRRRDPGMNGATIRAAFEADTPLGQIEHRAAWHPQGEVGRWVVRNPAVVLIGGTLFAHGGVSARYADIALEELNRRVAVALLARDASSGAIINDPLGPLWYRGYIRRDGDAEAAAQAASAPPLPPEQELALVLTRFGARRMVVGHTPNLAGIQQLHGGRLIAIDTGMSAHYGGPRSYLEIVNGQVTAHVVGGGESR